MSDYLAKKEGVTIKEHTQQVLTIIKELSQIFNDVPRLVGREDFWKLVAIAAWLHDFGKIARGFQNMLKARGRPWLYRHEVISSSLSLNLQLERRAKMIVMGAIAAHHYKLEKITSPPSMNDDDWFAWIKRELGSQELDLKEILGNPPAPYDYDTVDLSLPNPNSYLHRWELWADELCWKRENTGYQREEWFPTNKKNRLWPILTLGALVAADHLASSGKTTILKEEKTKELLLAWSGKFYTFQCRAINSRAKHLLIEAPTGSGKTLLALAKAALWDAGKKRLFYVLPYRASIHAMENNFVDKYSIHKDAVAVLHARSAYHIYKSLEEEDPHRKYSMAKDLASETRKIYRPFKISTPYQVVKAVTGIHGFEPLWLEMVGATLVIDEVHAYEPWMVAMLLSLSKLVNDLGGHVILMTATWPDFLKKIFLDELRDTETISADSRFWSQKRHRIEVSHDPLEELESAIIEDLSGGKRVLVIANTVSEAQKIYDLFKCHATNPRLLHSRFRNRDREKIEADLIKSGRVDLLVGTQAIEVSLDISFDTLYTQIAPVDALVQRIGRVNRLNKSYEPAKILVSLAIDPGSAHIYGDKALSVASEILRKANGSVISNAKAREMVLEQYEDGWSLREYKLFEETYQVLNKIIEEPPVFCRHKDFNFLDQMENSQIEVFLSEDQEMIGDSKNIFQILDYAIPLNYGNFKKLERLNRVRKEDDFLFVEAPYDESTGLHLSSIGSKEDYCFF